MYTKSVPFRDFNDKPRTQTVHFNLTEREVFKLLAEFKAVFDWQESLKGDERELSTAEVIEFYNNFEEILLSAWGEPSEDGLHFRKSGRYDFEESALFAACMVEFVSDPRETSKLIDGLMPKNLQDIVKKADENLALMAKDANNDEDVRAELARLRARVQEQDSATKPAAE